MCISYILKYKIQWKEKNRRTAEKCGRVRIRSRENDLYVQTICNATPAIGSKFSKVRGEREKKQANSQRERLNILLIGFVECFAETSILINVFGNQINGQLLSSTLAIFGMHTLRLNARFAV